MKNKITLAVSLVVGLAFWVESAPAAQAQGRPDTTAVELHNADLANLGGTLLSAQRQLLLVSTTPQRGYTELRQLWCDYKLRRRRQVVVRLPGKLALAAVQPARQHALVQLLTPDTLVLASLDTLGRLVAVQRQPLTMRRRLFEARELSLPETDFFVTAEQKTKNPTCHLVCRSPDLTLRWEKTYEPDALLIASAADATHLWVVLQANALTRHPGSTALCLELATGRELCRVNLTSEGARRVPIVASIALDHSLLVAGNAYEHDAALLRRTGDLFVQRIAPDGRLLTDRTLDFREQPELHGARAELVQWQLLWPQADGRLALVGETYDASSAGGQILRGSLTMGIAGSATLRPRDIVTLRLTPAGQSEDLYITPVSDETVFRSPNHEEHRRLADVANEAGVFRIRGLTSDSSRLVLKTRRYFATLGLSGGTPQEIWPVQDGGYSEALTSFSGYLLLLETLPHRKGIRLLRVPLPAR